MQPIISIIVPCYNQAKYLPETLESVLSQTIDNWECVIVNDGSQDNTIEIARDYALKDSRFVLVDKPNGGLADARNAGIKASHGKYILPLDSDDKIGVEYAQLAVEYLESHPDTKLVYCKARFFGIKNEDWILPEYNYDNELWKNLIFCSSVYRRYDYDQTDGYNINMKYGYEDWDYLLSFLKEEDKVYMIPQTLFFYRTHKKCLSTNLQQHSAYSYKQIILNHIDIYEPFLGDLFLQRSRIKYLEEELNKVLSSKKYRIGCKIFSVLNFFKFR